MTVYFLVAVAVFFKRAEERAIISVTKSLQDNSGKSWRRDGHNAETIFTPHNLILCFGARTRANDIDLWSDVYKNVFNKSKNL